MIPTIILGTACALALAQPTNLIHNGDFELDVPDRPPPGWTMWGAERYKDPANYTRDTTNPHGGQACFRIHHPADTAGYIVTDPGHAIRPKRDMIYTVSFWARTDKPGDGALRTTCYETIAPYVDAPSAGSFPIELTEEWQPFRFELREGLDFSADRSRYLMLNFTATTDQAEERTLWIDDVEVVDTPNPQPARLIDEATLEYEPLQHRLQPGGSLQLTIDAGRRVRPATSLAGGVSFHRVAGWTGHPYDREGNYTLPETVEAGIREMHLPMTRFYAVGAEPFGVEASIDRAAEVCGRCGIPEEHVVLELETQGATEKLPPETWARAVAYSRQKGYAFRYWEVANEPYAALWGRDTAFPSADDYIDHFLAVSSAIRQADPTAQVGVAINTGNLKWGQWVLKRAAGHYDFVVGHYYCGARVHERSFEDIALTENWKMLDRVLRINALIRVLNPDRQVYQLDTEWGMHSSNPEGQRADYVDRNANLWGTLHRAVRLIHYAREGMLRGASSWQMLSRTGGQGFGILFPDAPDQRSLLYWLYYYFNRHVGDHVLDIEGTAPWYEGADAGGTSYSGPSTPAVATLADDGSTLYLVVANGSWTQQFPCRVQLKAFRVADATAVVLSDFRSDPEDAKPLLDREEDAVAPLAVEAGTEALTFTLPARSVAFLTARRG